MDTTQTRAPRLLVDHESDYIFILVHRTEYALMELDDRNGVYAFLHRCANRARNAVYNNSPATAFRHVQEVAPATCFIV